MTFKRISFIFLFMLFLSIPNIFSYTLPKESDMYSFLPDKIGNWVADNTFDMRPFLDNPSLNPGYSKARSAFRSYINGKTPLKDLLIYINKIYDYEILYITKLTEHEKAIVNLWTLSGGNIWKIFFITF